MLKGFFRLADVHPANHNARARDHFLRAVDACEYRPPRKGEWYLSGAIVEAYRAPNDLEGKVHIARIVEVRRADAWEVVCEVKP